MADASAKVSLRVLMLGDSGVGKSSLMTRFIEGRFSQRYAQCGCPNRVATPFPPCRLACKSLLDSTVQSFSFALRTRSPCCSMTSTIGIDYASKIVNVAGTSVRLTIWDTA